MLEVREVRAGYGAINVLWDVSIEFPRGELMTVIGPNGAGKTTLLRAIAGQIAVTQGGVTLDGNSLSGTPTWRMPEHKLALIPEGRMVFRDMTVLDNLLLGAYPKANRAAAPRNLERAFAMFPRLAERRRQLAGSLSGGEAQMLAMARALMSEPEILLIDEPSLGLAPVIVQEIFATLAELKRERRTMVLVEQNTAQAVALADRVILMQSGRVGLACKASEVDLTDLHRRYFSG